MSSNGLRKLRSPTLREVIQTQQRVTTNQQARVRDRAVLMPTAQPRLAARISSGYLSNGLPWLKVERNRMVNAETNRPVLLRGVNRSGLEYSEPTTLGFADAAGITSDQIREIVENWGANIIRLPFNQDWALNGRAGLPAMEYLRSLDQVIHWASSFGAYVLLDLQWLDADTPFGGSNHVAPLPNLDSIVLWGMLAQRYRLEPAVLFDIFNEPHSPLPDDPNPLEGIDETGFTFPLRTRAITMREWQPWARQLIAAIRRVHTNSLIFVSGVDWGYDLRGMPLTIARGRRDVFANIVYSTHVYPRKGPESVSSRPEPLPGPQRAPSWYQAFGHLTGQLPIFAGEWGVDGGQEDVDTHRLWAERLGQYFSSLGMGWTAWSWSDHPRLTRPLAVTPAEPTRYGQVVRYFLSQP